ncbi:hypothetical protein [Enterococcus rivorum]|uniref:Uncharacterized protein n=1 Tax=Enterococcus rivorum TaxID=762845 RepID=A0A1E5KYH8_9ENTE|nr:hypothetical protein [Enterococcus rivorum]MBP2097481.1 hypothetical protein [Enterococcus rivorum]OEH82941.1 hypothetical protein BCR26_01305 [Enterococcus rivorum]
MNISTKIREKSTGKVVTVTTLLFISMLILLNVISFQLTKNTGEQIFDFSLNYSPETAYRMIANYGSEGRSLYRIMLILDFLFPITYMLFGITLTGYLVNHYFPENKKLNTLFFVTIMGMIFDWIENIFILTMLNNFPEKTDFLANYTRSFTILKFSLLGITVLSLLLMTIVGLSSRYRKQVKY